jgi:alpha-glucoside transport system permease protein
MNRQTFADIFNKIPVNLAIIVLCAIWLLPTLGLLVTSFRPQEAVNTTGWWSAFDTAPTGAADYETFCSSCHGANLESVEGVNLGDQDLIATFRRSLQLTALFNQDFNGTVHIPEAMRPDSQQTADILAYLRIESGLQPPPETFTTGNYEDVMVGYSARSGSYREVCEEEGPTGTRSCDFLEDATRPDAVFQGMINSFAVAIPATILPIIIAGFASYALSWMDFNGRRVLFAALVGLQIVPLQMVLVPIFRLYTDIGLNGSFLGVWLFHTGVGLPYAIYLIRNFIGRLPAELFESAYLDGAGHFTVFRQIVLPLALPAIAALAIFQFLWVWNDLLVALIFLGNQQPVLTYQLSQLVDSLGGGWHRMTAAAFISIIVPLVVFVGFQRFFVRGLLAGAVKG